MGVVIGARGRAAAQSRASTEAELNIIGGVRADAARQAIGDRDELQQLIASLPSATASAAGGVRHRERRSPDRVRGLAIALAETRSLDPFRGRGGHRREIAQLEAQANPLDRDASEDRVRRLALLKRAPPRPERAGCAVARRFEGKLENCALALQNIRFDVLRLKTGGQSTSHVTLVAERAMSLARDVDAHDCRERRGARGAPAREPSRGDRERVNTQSLRDRLSRRPEALLRSSTGNSGVGAWPWSSPRPDVRLHAGVALKVLPPELAFRSDVRSRFLREAQMAAALSHPTSSRSTRWTKSTGSSTS